jgi:polysaccharide deacetylase family protein (PEP-CTERM system associated)
MLNALTFDVEDGWSIFSRDLLSREMEPAETVVKDTERILSILAGKNVRATFFVVGKVAKKFPSLVRRIADARHELGMHGFSHMQIFRLTENEFRSDVKEAKAVIEDSASAEVTGYRAPAFSLSPETKWSLRILAEEGFRYDSSIVPCKNPRYGWEGFSKDICRVDFGDGLCIVEVPLSVFPIPMTDKGFLTGGGYLRHFPYFISHAVIKHIQKTRPAIVYMHPYEFGKETVSLSMEQLSTISRLKMRMLACWALGMGIGNRRTMPGKLQKLLSAFNFGPIGDVIDQWLGRQT